jgi:hypothetical protein
MFARAGILSRPTSNAYGTLTTAWITATGETDTTILGALNTLESDLTTYGLTSKMKALYPFVGGTATKHKYNFIDAQDTDAAFRLVFYGGWTHDSTGALSGANGYADTKLIPSSSLTDANTHASYYSRTNRTGFEVTPMGIRINSDAELRLQWYSGTFYLSMYDVNSRINVSQSDGRGLFLGSRTASNSLKMYRNGSQIGSTGTTSGGANFSSLTNSIYIGAINVGNSPIAYSNISFGFSSIGSGLTDTDTSNLYTAVQAFQTTLGRNV